MGVWGFEPRVLVKQLPPGCVLEAARRALTAQAAAPPLSGSGQARGLVGSWAGAFGRPSFDEKIEPLLGSSVDGYLQEESLEWGSHALVQYVQGAHWARCKTPGVIGEAQALRGSNILQLAGSQRAPSGSKSFLVCECACVFPLCSAEQSRPRLKIGIRDTPNKWVQHSFGLPIIDSEAGCSAGGQRGGGFRLAQVEPPRQVISDTAASCSSHPKCAGLKRWPRGPWGFFASLGARGYFLLLFCGGGFGRLLFFFLQRVREYT